jgi:hypothetical protein
MGLWGLSKWKSKMPLEEGMAGIKKGVQHRFALKWVADNVNDPNPAVADQAKDLTAWLKDFSVAETLAPLSIVTLSESEVRIGLKRMVEREALVPFHVWEARWGGHHQRLLKQLPHKWDDASVHAYVTSILFLRSTALLPENGDESMEDVVDSRADTDDPKIYQLECSEADRVQLFIQAAFVQYLFPRLRNGFSSPSIDNVKKFCQVCKLHLEHLAETSEIENDTALGIVDAVDALNAIIGMIDPGLTYTEDNVDDIIIESRQGARNQTTVKGLLSGAIQDCDQDTFASIADDIKKYRPMVIKHMSAITEIKEWLASLTPLPFDKFVTDLKAHCKTLSQVKPLLREATLEDIIASAQTKLNNIFESVEDLLPKCWDDDDRAKMLAVSDLLQEASYVFPFDPNVNNMITILGEAVAKNTMGERRGALANLCDKIIAHEFQNLDVEASVETLKLCGLTSLQTGLVAKVDSMSLVVLEAIEKDLPNDSQLTAIAEYVATTYKGAAKKAFNLDLYAKVRQLYKLVLECQGAEVQEIKIRELLSKTKIIKNFKGAALVSDKGREALGGLIKTSEDLINGFAQKHLENCATEIDSALFCLVSGPKGTIEAVTLNWDSELTEADHKDMAAVLAKASSAFQQVDSKDLAHLLECADKLSQASCSLSDTYT